MTCPFGTMDWYCCLAAGHAGPHESHELPPDTSTNPSSVPSLDVEACVRLLTEEADNYERFVGSTHGPEADGIRADIALRRALASALPGMGKDGERLDWLEHQNSYTQEVRRGVPILPTSCGYSVREYIDTQLRSMNTPVSARAAQPEETSADAK